MYPHTHLPSDTYVLHVYMCICVDVCICIYISKWRKNICIKYIHVYVHGCIYIHTHKNPPAYK